LRKFLVVRGHWSVWRSSSMSPTLVTIKTDIFAPCRRQPNGGGEGVGCPGRIQKVYGARAGRGDSGAGGAPPRMHAGTIPTLTFSRNKPRRGGPRAWFGRQELDLGRLWKIGQYKFISFWKHGGSEFRCQVIPVFFREKLFLFLIQFHGRFTNLFSIFRDKLE
jgi:hypothetical protein